MSYPGLTFALMLGVAIGTAVYYYFAGPNNQNSYSYGNNFGSTGLPSQLPVVTRGNGRKKKEINCCTICLKNVTDGRHLTSCGHVFHSNCIQQWLKRQNSCPNCRARV